MSDASKAVDRFLRAYMTPELENNGFRKVRRRYRRRVEDRLETISVEAHTFGHAAQASFEVSASIYLPEIARALGREVADLDKVKGFECGVFSPARQLMPRGNGFLGVVTLDEAENSVQGRLLIEGLRDGVLPWFERLRDPSRLVEYMRPRAYFQDRAWKEWAKRNGVEL